MSTLSCVGIVSGNPGCFLFRGAKSLDPSGLPLFLCGMTTLAAGGLLLCSGMSILAGVLAAGMCDLIIFRLSVKEFENW